MKVVTLQGMDANSFMKERDNLLKEGAMVPPLFTTQEKYGEENLDKKVYITMDMFLKKKRNGDFGYTFDLDGIMIGMSNYVFIN